MSITQLIQRIQTDPTLDTSNRNSLISMLTVLARVNPNMSGPEILNAVGGGILATLVGRYLGISPTGQSIMGAAGIGLGLNRARGGGDPFRHTYIGADNRPWTM